MKNRRKRIVCGGFSVLGKGDDIPNIAVQGGTDAIQQKAVVACDGVFVILVDDRIADAGHFV